MKLVKIANLIKNRTNDEFSAFVPAFRLVNADGFRWFNGNADVLMNCPAHLG